MKDTWISFLHSYQYIPNTNNISINNDVLIDNSGKRIMGLKNIPKASNIYKIELDIIYPKKKSLKYNLVRLSNIRNETNLKIMIKVNVSLLENKVLNGEYIPYRAELFKLIRRNIRNYINYNENVNNYINIQNFNNLIPTNVEFNRCKLYNFQLELYNWVLERENGTFIKCLNTNIIKINNLYVDCDLERFYNKKHENMENNIFVKGGIILNDSCSLTRASLSYLISNIYNIKKFNIKDGYLETNASLVICPNNLCDKWSCNFTNTGKKCIVITNKTHLEKYTYNDIVNSDIVIISINILTNAYYLKNWEEYQSNGQNINDAFETILYEKIRNPNLKIMNNIIFQLFNWKRIIYDEINSYTKNKIIFQMLNIFNTTTKWVLENYNMTINTLINCYKILTNTKIEFNLEILYKFSTLSIRTKINLKKIIKYEDIRLTFSNIEKKFYPLIKNKNAFCSLPLNFIKINNKYYNKLPKNSKIKNNVDLMLKQKDICSICLQTLSKKDIGITDCNHVFCYTCLYNSSLHVNTCPNCRSNLSFYKLNFTKSVNHYCSKIDKLVKILDNIPKTLIVSQYDDTISNIYKILLEKNKNVSIYNSKYNYKFNKVKKGYLLLNSKYIDNLSYIDNINEIIFVEPIYKNIEYVIDNLVANICNYKYKNIKIIRLIYNNSIES